MISKSRASEAWERFLQKLLKAGYVFTTIPWLRERFPWARNDATPISGTIPELKDVSDAVKHYQRPRDYFNSTYYLKTYDRADYYGAPPEIRQFTWRFMRALRARGLPFYVHTCFRHPDEQLRLRNLGHSKTSFGPHQRACAVDIVSSVDHWDIPQDLWYYVGTLGESVARSVDLPIKWGGRWNFYDPAHWELEDWENRPALENDHEPLRLSPYSDKMRW